MAIVSRLRSYLILSTMMAVCCLPAVVQPRVIDLSRDTVSVPFDVEFLRRRMPWAVEEDTAFYRKGTMHIVGRMVCRETVFLKNVDFTGVVFDSAVDFGDAAFRNEATFNNATFKMEAGFNSARFSSKVSFLEAALSYANFAGAIFDSAVSFEKVWFPREADFTSALFSGRTLFWSANFDSASNFNSVRFLTMADFRRARFGDVDFAGSHFHEEANFDSTKFDSTATFDRAVFDSTINLSYSSLSDFFHIKTALFLGEMILHETTLPGQLDLREMKKMDNELDLSVCRLREKSSRCRIALRGADIDKIKLRMDLFQLWFPDDAICFDDKISVYEQLLNKLKSDGLMESYELLDIERLKLNNRHDAETGSIIEYCFWPVANVVLEWWWNFGYTKERIFLWMLGFLTVFSVINFVFYRRLTEGVYTVGFVGTKCDSNFSGKRRKWYYRRQVIFFTIVVFFGLKLSLDNFRKGAIKRHPWLFSYLLLIYLSGLVCLGFVVNIIFTI